MSLLHDDNAFARPDHDRARRCGWPEVIYGAGKTAPQIAAIFKSLMEKQEMPVYATRVDEEKAEEVLSILPQLNYDAAARILYDHMPEKEIGMIAICCAGTSDLPVAEEAAFTARLMGANVVRLYDVGVAGIHRLLSKEEILRQANAIVAVAGMEGALPSVIGGLVSAPVIAVPTSVGYGASFGGVSALLAMINSCAPGVSVVNIDNGFGAGYMAAVINQQSCNSAD